METFDKIIEIVRSKITSQETENELARIVLRNCNIPFLREITNEVYLIDLLGLDYKKITDDIFLITNVNKNYRKVIMPGDYVIGAKLIDKKDFSNKNISVKFNLFIYRKNAKKNFMKKHFKIKLIRKEEIENLEGFYYLPIDNFHSSEKKSHFNYKKIIIDLRNNGGGQVNRMIDLYSQIFGRKILMSKSDQNTINFYINSFCDCDRKVYILVNEFTASAAEIFAYIAQKCECATIIGTKTYGKNYLCKPMDIGTIKLSFPIYKFLIFNAELSSFKPNIYFEEINNIDIYNIPKIIRSFEE